MIVLLSGVSIAVDDQTRSKRRQFLMLIPEARHRGCRLLEQQARISFRLARDRGFDRFLWGLGVS